MKPPTERLPRFKRKPGALPNFEIMPRDEEIIRIVARHRFIRSDQIVALIKALYPEASEQKLIRRLRLLFDANYLSRPLVQLDSYRVGRGGSQRMAVILGNKAVDLLASKYGFRRSSADWTSKARTATRGTIDHALSVTDIMVALALACSRRGLQMAYFDDIMREFAPAETRANPQPYHWPVSVRPLPGRWQGRAAQPIYVIPDKTFGIHDVGRPEGRQRSWFFLEADRGNMPVVRPGLEKSSLLRKLIGYGFTHEDGLHRRYYGLSNFRVLTVVPTRQRINTILAAHQQHTAKLFPAALCLFADRRGLFDAEDFFAYPWIDAAGQPHRLLD